MPSQTIVLPLTKSVAAQAKAFDASGNDISSLCVFSCVVSPSTGVITAAKDAVVNGLFHINSVAAGSATIDITATNASGSTVETDAINVVVAAPNSLSVSYGTPA